MKRKVKKMKLLTFNVQHFRNYITREIDIDLFARTIKEINPDIICLNEVFGEGSNDMVIKLKK